MSNLHLHPDLTDDLNLRLRAERLLSLLPSGVGALASDQANVRWLTGLAGEPHRLYRMAPLWVVLGPDGELRLVAPASELAWIEERFDLDRVVPHGHFALRGDPSAQLRAAVATGRSFAEAIGEALAAVGASHALLVDDASAPSTLEQLAHSLHPRELCIDRMPWLQARAVKDAAEIAALRRVNHVAEQAIAGALERADVGVSEHDLLRWIRETMVACGAQPLLGSVGIGERGALVDFAVSARTLSESEAIRLDVGCTLDGYHADLARTAVLGEPPAWLVEAHAALLAGERAALSALRPGVSGADVFNAAVEAVRAGGLDDYERVHCGHGIGLDMYELPPIRSDAREPIRAGMTCCLETPLYLIGQAGVQVEDAVAVTDTGFQRLGSLPQALLAAGAPIELETKEDDV